MEEDKKARASLRNLEESGLGRKQIRIMLIAGMSFFTDAYDLFVIGVAILLLIPAFHLDALQTGLLVSSALFGAVVGPVIFGIAGDKFGRKNTFWITVTILIIGAIGSALSVSYIMLLFWRFVLGVGIGGDYPVSSTIVAEYSNRRDRGKLISSTFAMQGFGIIAGIVIALTLFFMNVPGSLIWRLLLGFGAIPVASILYYRMKFEETQWFKNAKHSASKPGKARTITREAFFRKRWKILAGTTLSWFINDVTYYGTTIFTPYLIGLFGFSGLLAATKTSAVVLVLFAVPGYWIAVSLIDREGRKPIQYIGFLVTGIAFIVLALAGRYILAISSVLFFFIYGLTFLFTNYGPNTTTYVYPAELYPTQYRATGHGLASMSGKLGAAISALLFPLLIVSIGKYALIGVLGALSLMGFLITIFLLPETKRRSLIETSGEVELGLVTTMLSEEFSSLIHDIDRASMTLYNALDSGHIADAKVLFDNVKANEHDADRYVHDIFNYITNVRVDSIAYLDISHLAKRLDDIIDTEEMVSSRLYLYGLHESDKHMQGLGTTIIDSMKVVKSAVSKLSELQGASDDSVSDIRSDIMKLYKKCSKSENEADDILREALKDIMRGSDVKRIMKYKEIYEGLESVSDRCVDAMDVITDITLRYTYRTKR
ncbi:MAG: MFS transporter [Candidatus Micrarchaeia archaeon]